MEQLLQDVVENRQKKNALLQSMLEITIRQKAQLSADEVEALAETTKNWDALATEIDQLEKTYKEQMQRLSQGNAAQLLEAVAGEIAKLDENAKAILRNIQKENMECNTIANERMQAYKGELKEAKKSNQRASTYVNAYAISEDGLYFDKKQ